MAESVLLTREGLQRIKEEHEELVSVRRSEVAQRIKEAREFGDISENAEYDAAKNEQAEVEERIKKLEDMIRKAELIEDTKHKKGRVNIGSQVEVKDIDKDKTMVFTIVGTTEADPMEGKISNESKVGEALIGTKVGDIIDIEVPAGIKKYEVISINK